MLDQCSLLPYSLYATTQPNDHFSKRTCSKFYLFAITLNQHPGQSSAGLDTETARFSSLLLKTNTSFPATNCKARTSLVFGFSTKNITPSGWFGVLKLESNLRQKLNNIQRNLYYPYSK